MGSGYVLIVAVLLLGGVIATLGDRIGTKVGKARLSLFNLRPRQTATLVSIATGSIISASTLTLLFSVSSQLRTGVFELGKIQDDLAQAQNQLERAQREQDEVEDELASATTERERARERLQEINRSLQAAREQQQTTEEQLQQTRQQQQTTEGQLQQTRSQLSSVSQQATGLRSEIESLRVERENLQRQQESIQAQIAERDQEIAERDVAIAQREQLLAQLETQQQFLSQQVADLERQYQGLFRGNIALGRNQELVSGVIQVDNSNEATQVITRLLFEANRTALQRIAPGTPTDRQVISIETREVERLIDRLSDGQEYVIQVLSAANYVIGEPCVASNEAPCVQVFVDAAPNRLVYQAGERLASTQLENAGATDRELVERLNLLIAATQFRARQDGIVGTAVQIADNRTESLLSFLESVKTYGQPLELQTIAASPIFTTGPIQIELLATRNGVVIFETGPILSFPGLLDAD
ncbi:DUF3084 domain-containing protein [Pseudanabaena sp. FACHB-2040]|uniref:DUF3084 domain-containing protein n=1 Tax=Pseudanabaena sp. FACHB-2040 TaxID=2692859 RepID=UPI0016873B60|nr:DUF3084 domain-containing protein [Pseudanabaena sp. FACHB-2040]MBD0267708.1 DUF3084 domain-containing protein [Cyanobacteria bacterium Co-bin8]MBD2259882.1 DUF3084 domain-containing protein [Pseudanabaena sp. FACHB-2040]